MTKGTSCKESKRPRRGLEEAIWQEIIEKTFGMELLACPERSSERGPVDGMDSAVGTSPSCLQMVEPSTRPKVFGDDPGSISASGATVVPLVARAEWSILRFSEARCLRQHSGKFSRQVVTCTTCWSTGGATNCGTCNNCRLKRSVEHLVYRREGARYVCPLLYALPNDTVINTPIRWKKYLGSYQSCILAALGSG